MRGINTLKVEVTSVSLHGLWLLIGDAKKFVTFDDFPWFRDASIGLISKVEMPQPGHLYWPELDIDLSVESLDLPERFPLVSRVNNFSLAT